ncbi:4341_t:CDS:1, partial [Gigaspora margarita]
SLEEVKKHLEELEVYRELAKLPITNQNKIKNTVAQLHKFFIFKKALDFVLDLPPLPEATWDDILEKLLSY